jgi:hypothetical protein
MKPAEMNLDNLGLPTYWKGLGDSDEIRLTFVLPTGRAVESGNGHIALSSDGLYLPEIALAVEALARRADVEIVVRTVLDIDYLEDLQAGDRAAENLVISGSGGVNCVASLLFDNVMAYKTLNGGFTEPYNKVADIRGLNQTCYTYANNGDSGALAMFRNPWTSEERVAISCAGLLAVGSAAALMLLLHYLQNKGDGNNRFDRSKPLKIVDGHARQYSHVNVRHYKDCVPKMEIASITDLTILE